MKNTIVLTLLFISSLAFADKFCVQPFARETGASESNTATTELVKDAVQETGHQVVDNPSECEFTLKGKVLKLGESYILSLEKFKKSERVGAKKLKTNLDDMDRAASRVTRAIIDGENAKKNVTLDDVTKEDVESTNRRIQTMKQLLIGFGPVFFDNMGSSDIGIGATAAYQYTINPEFDAKLEATFAVGKDESSINVLYGAIELDYFFTNGNISPFLGLELGFGTFAGADNSSLLSKDREDGFVGGVALGVKFFRASTLNILAIYNYTYLFEKLSRGNPSMSSLQVGISFEY